MTDFKTQPTYNGDDLATEDYVNDAISAIETGSPQGTFLVSGGQVTWITGYQYQVAAGTGRINGTLYSWAAQTVTLDAADPSDSRIDVIYVGTTSTVDSITGTASSNPSEPVTDAATQLKLSLVLVEGGTTEPTISSELVYAENVGSSTEWNWTTSGSGWNVNSTSNPRSGTKDIEGTTVAQNAYAEGQRGTGTISPSDYDQLVLYLRFKGVWGANRYLAVSLLNAGVQVGNALRVSSGFWGLTDANTTTYQAVIIPTLQFAASPGAVFNQIRIQAIGTGGTAIGVYLDDIMLTSGGTVIIGGGGLTQDQADARYLRRANNLTDVASAATSRGSIGAAPASAGYVTIASDSELSGEALLSNIHGKGTEAARPGAGIVGRLYYSTDTTNGHRLYRDTGSTWETLPVQWADMVAEKPKLDQIDNPVADLDMDGFKITDLGTPTSASDAATKDYVDSSAGGSWKASVRVATTAAGTLASSFENGDTVDGTTLATGDRILIKDQATGSENGIYTVNASGAPTRATDADSAAKMLQAAVFVRTGTANADKAFVCTNDSITLGSTNLSFTQFGGSNSSITIQEADGSPTGSPGTLKFPNGTLTDNGDGSFTYTPTTGATPAMVKIDEQIVTGSSVSSITVSSIPGTYRDLVVHITGRGTTSATNTGVSMRPNNDTGGNYANEQTAGGNTSISGAGSNGDTKMIIGPITAATAQSNQAGSIKVTIFDYARTQWNKNAISDAQNDRSNAASGQFITHNGSSWRSTSAITSLVLFCDAGDFAVGTVVTTYGVG